MAFVSVLPMGLMPQEARVMQSVEVATLGAEQAVRAGTGGWWPGVSQGAGPGL